MLARALFTKIAQTLPNLATSATMQRWGFSRPSILEPVEQKERHQYIHDAEDGELQSRVEPQKDVRQ